jgi:beta-mannosidase
VDLTGVWRVLPADDDLRRDGIGVDVDDSGWPELVVPGHWRDHPDFVDHDGPFLYRRRYEQSEPPPGRRRWITLDGVFYQGDVWLDGAYLGDPEGYFFPHTYDITALSGIGTEHTVAVEVTCAPQRSHRGRRNVTGVFQYWDGIDRGWNPGGLWRPVKIYDTGPVRVDRLRVLCRDADATRAHILLTARLDSDAPRAVTVRTLVDGEPVAELERRVATGLNEVAWNVDVTEPALWWPRGLGEQAMTTVSVEVWADGVRSDRRKRRTGLRTVAWNDWKCSVNGERLFLKGANVLPSRADLAHATRDDQAALVGRAVEAGLDCLRVHGHIAPRGLYDAADRAGLLLLQDFPLQWAYSRSVRGAAVEQARAAVDTLGHHPSIVQWNAHNDPVAVAVGIEGPSGGAKARYLLGQQLPTWNKSVLDRWVKRAFERADPTRLTVPHSGVLPHLPLLDGTDSHFYFGWFHGDATDIERLAQRVPRLVRFLSEFGAQAAPSGPGPEFIDDALAGRTWPDLDWDVLAQRYGLQKWVFDERVPPESFATFEQWRQASQVYQAELIKHHIELLRRIKYRPAGGFALFSLNESAPLVGWGVLDSDDRPKLGWHALRHACAPVLVAADRPPAIVEPGDTVALDVHVVNDLRDALDAEVTATLRWAGGSRQWSFGGEVGADSVAKVAQLRFDVPHTLGKLELDLALESVGTPRVTADNHYHSVVTVPPVLLAR